MRALGMLLALILTTMPVYAVDAQYRDSVTLWPMAIGSIMFIAAVVFCVTAMRRMVNGDLHQAQEARLAEDDR